MAGERGAARFALAQWRLRAMGGADPGIDRTATERSHRLFGRDKMDPGIVAMETDGRCRRNDDLASSHGAGCPVQVGPASDGLASRCRSRPARRREASAASENIQRRRTVESMRSDNKPGGLDQVLSIGEGLELSNAGRDVPKIARGVLRALRTHFFPGGIGGEDPEVCFTRLSDDFLKRALLSEIWGDWILELDPAPAEQERARLRAAWRHSGNPIVKEAVADVLWRSVEPAI